MKPKSRFPMPRRLWSAFLVGAVFFAPCGLYFLEFCVGVFAHPIVLPENWTGSLDGE
jgi:hypothetical protein